jgi:hypothetical protein
MRSLLLGKIASDLAAKRSRIFSATARSAGSSEARGSDTTFCSIALTGSVDFTGVASMVAAGESLAGAVGAEDVSADCPAGEAPVGTAVKSPHWKTLKRATRVTATVMPAKIRSKRGPFILRTSPRQSQLHSRISEADARLWRLPSLSPYNSPFAQSILNPTAKTLPNKKGKDKYALAQFLRLRLAHSLSGEFCVPPAELAGRFET